MILVRYVLKEPIAPFLAALLGITFLFVVDFLVKILDNVLSKGLPAETVLEIFALNLAWMLSLSIPMAVLVDENSYSAAEYFAAALQEQAAQLQKSLAN